MKFKVLSGSCIFNKTDFTAPLNNTADNTKASIVSSLLSYSCIGCVLLKGSKDVILVRKLTRCEQNRDRKLLSFNEKLLLHFYVLSFLNVTGLEARKALEQPDKCAANLRTCSSARKPANKLCKCYL